MAKNKRKVIYSESYKKGTLQDKSVRPVLVKAIKNMAKDIELLEAGKYDDGNGYIVIKVEFKL
jgi:hypothetical protein